MTYTKHKIWRIEDINDKFFEVLISKESLTFAPGAAVKLYKSGMPSVLIASGIAEAWVRLIMNRDIYRDLFEDNQLNVRLEKQLETPLKQLFAEEEPSFVVTSSGIGALFSYASTFPDKKLKVCYLGKDKVQKDWVEQNHILCKPGLMSQEQNVYISGNQKVIEKKAPELISISKEIHYCE